MSGIGTLRVRVFTSKAQIPVEGATVVVTGAGENGKQDLISLQITDRSGLIVIPMRYCAARRITRAPARRG